MDKKLPQSLRKYIRKEKSRIRREILDIYDQEKKIKELMERYKKPENKLTKTTEKNKINIEKKTIKKV